MPIQIVITGDNTNQALSEIKLLATALGMDQQSQPASPAPQKTAPVEDKKEEKPAASETETKVAPKEEKLSRKEQDAAVSDMIKAGEIDKEYFDRLTAGRQKKVTEALEKQAEEAKKQDDLDDMFDEDDAEEKITRDSIRAFMASYGKDEDGNAVQENLLAIREVLTEFIPEGVEVKVGNIPEDKIEECYGALKELEEDE